MIDDESMEMLSKQVTEDTKINAMTHERGLKPGCYPHHISAWPKSPSA
jgi:hypothetical protein